MAKRALFVPVVLLVACAPEPAGGDAPYWVIDHEGGRSVLLGTMHAEVDADELPSALWEALSDSAVLVTEADMRYVDAIAFRRAVTLPEEESLEAAVTPSEWAAIVEAFDGRYAPESLDRLQPWYLEGELVRSMLAEVDPIDLTLVARAEEQGVPLGFFETWEHQVDLLNGLGLDDGAAVLLQTVGDPEGVLEAHMTWAEAYREADLERLTELAFDPAAVSARPQYYEDIVYRHELWMPSVEEHLRAGDAFIAAGFMHMLGPRGLVALLEERGYDVSVGGD